MPLAIVVFMVLLPVAKPFAGNFGLGLALGDPSMLTMQHRLSQANWIGAGLAWNTSGSDSLYIHGDYLWNKPNIFQAKLPIFLSYGVGIRLTNREVDDTPRPKKKKETGLGVRVPVGLHHFLREPAFEFFAQLAPVAEVVPDFEIDIDGGIGFRFYF